jgi:hypothetical protein
MSRYENTSMRRKLLRNNTKHKGGKVSMVYDTTIYGKVPERNDDLYVIATEGDRCDNLAFQFYGDSRLWWYIAQSNNISSMNIPAGTSLRIPASTEYAVGR